MRNWIASELRSKALHRDKRKLYSLPYKMTNGCCQTLTLTFPRSIKRARNKSDASERVLRLLREHLARGEDDARARSCARYFRRKDISRPTGLQHLGGHPNPANETGRVDVDIDGSSQDLKVEIF